MNIIMPHISVLFVTSGLRRRIYSIVIIIQYNCRCMYVVIIVREGLKIKKQKKSGPGAHFS